MNLKHPKAIFTIIVTTFVISIVYSQTINDNNIEFLRVKNQKEQGNYRKALNILFNNISEQNKSNSIYLSYSAECYEKLGIYDSAVIYYYKLYSQNQSYDVMQKIAELKDKEEEAIAKELTQKKAEDLKKEEAKRKEETKKNCQKCFGSGTYNDTIYCNTCGGSGLASCGACKGNGICTMCEGKGTLTHINKGYRSCLTCDNNLSKNGLEKKWYKTKEDVENIGNGLCYCCDGTGKDVLVCRLCKGKKITSIKTHSCYH